MPDRPKRPSARPVRESPPKSHTHPRAARAGRGRPPAPAQVALNTNAYISRSEGARLLGRSVTSMCRYEEIWCIDTSLRVKGVVYYPRQQFEEMRRALADDSGFDCYELFAQGLGPHEVTLRLRHRKPGMVRLYFQDFLANVALETSRMVLELDPDMNVADWKRAHGFPVDRPLHAAWVRCALERAALITSLREACDLAVERHEASARRRQRPA